MHRVIDAGAGMHRAQILVRKDDKMAETKDKKNTVTMVASLAAFVAGTLLLIYGHSFVAPRLGANALNPGASYGSEISADLLPEGTLEAYLSSDGSIFVRAAAEGFGGPVEFLVELDEKGNYSRITMGANSETAGMGSKVGNAEYLELYYGQRDPQSIDALSGASYTSDALKTVLELCNSIYEAVNSR